MTENEISRDVVDVAYKIHKKYGPGLLEHAYEKMMTHDLRKRGFEVQRQLPIPLVYDGEVIEESFKADLVINKKLIIELKVTEQMHPVFCRQLNTYLKVADLKLGLLVNFGMTTIKEGIERIINGQLDD